MGSLEKRAPPKTASGTLEKRDLSMLMFFRTGVGTVGRPPMSYDWDSREESPKLSSLHFSSSELHFTLFYDQM